MSPYRYARSLAASPVAHSGQSPRTGRMIWETSVFWESFPRIARLTHLDHDRTRPAGSRPVKQQIRAATALADSPSCWLLADGQWCPGARGGPRRRVLRFARHGVLTCEWRRTLASRSHSDTGTNSPRSARKVSAHGNPLWNTHQSSARYAPGPRDHVPPPTTRRCITCKAHAQHPSTTAARTGSRTRSPSRSSSSSP